MKEILHRKLPETADEAWRLLLEEFGADSETEHHIEKTGIHSGDNVPEKPFNKTIENESVEDATGNGFPKEKIEHFNQIAGHSKEYRHSRFENHDERFKKELYVFASCIAAIMLILGLLKMPDGYYYWLDTVVFYYFLISSLPYMSRKRMAPGIHMIAFAAFYLLALLFIKWAMFYVNIFYIILTILSAIYFCKTYKAK